MSISTSLSPSRALSIPLFYDHTWRGIFVDFLLTMDSAANWLRMSDAALNAELARLYAWVSSDDHGDRYAIEWLVGIMNRPPSINAIRAALKAIVPIPEGYWARARAGADVDLVEAFDPVAAALDEMPDDDERW
jgi:hypothetical protein